MREIWQTSHDTGYFVLILSYRKPGQTPVLGSEQQRSAASLPRDRTTEVTAASEVVQQPAEMSPSR